MTATACEKAAFNINPTQKKTFSIDLRLGANAHVEMQESVEVLIKEIKVKNKIKVDQNVDFPDMKK